MLFTYCFNVKSNAIKKKKKSRSFLLVELGTLKYIHFQSKLIDS